MIKYKECSQLVSFISMTSGIWCFLIASLIYGIEIGVKSLGANQTSTLEGMESAERSDSIVFYLIFGISFLLFSFFVWLKRLKFLGGFSLIALMFVAFRSGLKVFGNEVYFLPAISSSSSIKTQMIIIYETVQYTDIFILICSIALLIWQLWNLTSRFRKPKSEI
jgi:hypothetical protein